MGDMAELQKALQEARADIARLEKVNRDMRTRLGDRLVVLSSTKARIDEERRESQVLSEMIRATCSCNKTPVVEAIQTHGSLTDDAVKRRLAANAAVEDRWRSKF